MLQPGQTIYNLTVVQYCGGGAFGEVYYCRDISGKYLALKVIPKSRIGADWERELKGITNYRRIAEDTPGLLHLYHVGDDDDNFFYTMEAADPVPGMGRYVPDTLALRLERQGALAQDLLLPVLSGILRNINALHSAGFAHRDIKPENILFIGGRPKLADMGLLSQLSGTLTQLAGTLEFIPPEVRSGEYSSDSRESRQRNDLYAFGKIIYCCVSGNGASSFPSLPTAMDFGIVNRELAALSRRLCNRFPSQRLANLVAINREFARIEQLCQDGGGGNWRSHLRCFALDASRRIADLFCGVGVWLRRHPLALTALLFAMVLLLIWAGRWQVGRGAASSVRSGVPSWQAVLEMVANPVEPAHMKQDTKLNFLYERFTVMMPFGWQDLEPELHPTILFFPSITNKPKKDGKKKISNGIEDFEMPTILENTNDAPPPLDKNKKQMRLMPMDEMRTATPTEFIIWGLLLNEDDFRGKDPAEAVSMVGEWLPPGAVLRDCRAVEKSPVPSENALRMVLELPEERRVVAGWLFPQENHTLLVYASIHEVNLERDMPDVTSMISSLKQVFPPVE